MTTLAEYATVKLMVVFQQLTEEQARQIVADEVQEWQAALIPFPWSADISQVSPKVKASAWNYVLTKKKPERKR